MLNRRGFLGLLAGGLATVPLESAAQAPRKIPRVALLRPDSSPDPYVEAFRAGLRDLGYVEQKTIVLEYRWAEGRATRLRALAADLVRLDPDVIVTQGEEGARAAKEATDRIPIVMATSGDPVGAGLVASLAHPGGNITGLSTVTPDMVSKQLQLLREAVPRVSRVAVPSVPGNVALARGLAEAHGAAKALRLTLQPTEGGAADELGRAFDEMARRHADALFLFADVFTIGHQKPILALAARHRLPTLCAWLEAPDCMMNFGASRAEMFRLAATYVDKILNGVKPADLPVAQPTKLELVINTRVARSLGLTIAPSVLTRADQVIE